MDPEESYSFYYPRHKIESMRAVLLWKNYECHLDQKFDPPRLDVTIPLSKVKFLSKLADFFLLDCNSTDTPTKVVIRPLPNHLNHRLKNDNDPMFDNAESYLIYGEEIHFDVPIELL